ncbi:hypothetical protein [Bacillus alkalicellulosilyticus]|uniref:hypothetical protein n=1 Tax=Alkalihalobacterium alkalicellulosilyticum TaxID=1912214 RepID=UPI000996A7A5|nr:hypothetical protein [Bacillus alkalicellulosilyticus]
MTLLLIFSIPLLAYVSMRLFTKANWMVLNYQKVMVPYSLGVLIIYGYLLAFLIFPAIPLFSYMSMLYIIGIWIIGLIDDVFGGKETKGLTGHFTQLITRGKVSTGLLKVIGTVTLTYAFLLYLQPLSIELWIRNGLILLLTPHIMNLFDTRPLRVWKVCVIYAILLVGVFQTMPFFVYLYLLIFLFTHYVFEGHKLAMLGDNGATTLGAILAVVTVFHAPTQFQWYVVLLFITLTILAERVSFSKWIESSPLLRRIDRWGNYSTK